MKVRGNTKVENTLSGRVTQDELARWQVEQFVRTQLALPKDAVLSMTDDEETDDVLFTATWGGMGERPETEIPARPLPPAQAAVSLDAGAAESPSAPAPR